jgi:hypothetical protein
LNVNAFNVTFIGINALITTLDARHLPWSHQGDGQRPNDPDQRVRQLGVQRILGSAAGHRRDPVLVRAPLRRLRAMLYAIGASATRRASPASGRSA